MAISDEDAKKFGEISLDDIATGKPTEYAVDPARYGSFNTGIYVRAKLRDKWGSYDIGDLDAQSLLAWLRSHGGHHPWAENIIGLILGHGTHIAGN